MESEQSAEAGAPPPTTLMALPSDLIGRILIEVADSRRKGQEAFGATTGSVLHIDHTSNRTALSCCSRRLQIAGAPALTQDDRVGEQARRGRPGTPGPLASQRACRACPSFLGKAQTAARKSFIASVHAAPCRQAVAHRQTVSPLARHRTHIDVFEGSEDRESRRL